MSLYSEGGLWKWEWQRVKGFCFVSSCLWKPFEVLSPVYRAPHWENCLPAPASSFQGEPASAAARTAALCSSRQADTIPVPGSAWTPSAQHKYCIPCWLFWAAHGGAWKWKEAQSREVSREELCRPCFSGTTLSFPFTCERKRTWLLWWYVGMDS